MRTYKHYTYSLNDGTGELYKFIGDGVGILDGALVFYVNDNIALALAPGGWAGLVLTGYVDKDGNKIDPD